MMSAMTHAEGADLIAGCMIAWMEAAKQEQPEYFTVDPGAWRKLRRLERLEAVYAATVLPKRKLRKYIERNVHARRKQGMRRIARLERKEQ